MQPQALKSQVGGDHYRKYAIQPAEYNARNNLSFLAGNVVKYVTRYKDKGGAEDVRKAMHYLELILEFEYGGDVSQRTVQQQLNEFRCFACGFKKESALAACPKCNPPGTLGWSKSTHDYSGVEKYG